MNLEQLVLHVEKSFENACKEHSKLNDSKTGQEILNMAGMSGKKWKHFLNNLAAIPDCKWVEIGTWAGSTFCSALCSNNTINFAYTVDNSSQFSDLKEIAAHNINATYSETMLPSLSKIYIVEKDFREFFQSDKIPKSVDVYYFDGPHDYLSQKEGILLFESFLNKERCIILIDDWNWDEPRNGTYDALKILNRRVVLSKEIFTEKEDGTKEKDKNWLHKNRFANSDWHNGVAIFVLGESL